MLLRGDFETLILCRNQDEWLLQALGSNIFNMELVRVFQSVLDCQEPWHISGEDREALCR